MEQNILDEKTKQAFRDAIDQCHVTNPVDVRQFGMDLNQAEKIVREFQNNPSNPLVRIMRNMNVYLTDGEIYLDATGGSHISEPLSNVVPNG